MKRSTIKQAIRTAHAVCEHFQFALPPHANWTPEEWSQVGPKWDEVRDCMLGWDVADFGGGDFACRARLSQSRPEAADVPLLARLAEVPAELNSLLAKLKLLHLFGTPPKQAAFPAEPQM